MFEEAVLVGVDKAVVPLADGRLVAVVLMRMTIGRGFVVGGLISWSLSFSSSLVSAQTPGNADAVDARGVLVREIHPVTPRWPIMPDMPGRDIASLEFRAADEMTTADRELLAANEAEIARRAELSGFQLGAAGAGKAEEERAGKGLWRYEQAVCPVFPEHLVLQYSRLNEKGDVSLFTAVVPRGSGHVRVIPAQKRSYSLFTPAPASALTINDFNHIVKEEGRGLDPDWLTLGLCYAGLASGHVRAALIPSSPAQEKFPLFMPAKLTLPKAGGAEVHFVDISGQAQNGSGMDWVMTFTADGQLKKVRHGVAHGVVERPVPQTVVAVKDVP